MTETTRDTQLLQTFAKLADTLVDDYDVVELLHSLVEACCDLLDISAAGILLAGPSGELELVASTSEADRLVETMQLSARAGPCIDSFRTGATLSVPSIADVSPEWAAFRDSALDEGFRSAAAIPMRLRDVTIGTLNLFRSEPGALPEADRTIARALADVATIGILQERSARESISLSDQLHATLSTRVVIEQAKGVVSFTSNVPVDEAFQLIRRHARGHGLTVSDVAGRLVRRELTLDPHTDTIPDSSVERGTRAVPQTAAPEPTRPDGVMMRTLENSGGSYLTGGAIADAVMDYSRALAEEERTEVVDIPFIDSRGTVRRVQLLVGSRTELNSVQELESGRELVEPAVSDELHRRAEAVRHPSGDTPFTGDDDEFFDPEIY